MMPQRFDLIVFDWDGTLYDSTALIARCTQAAAADLGLPVPSQKLATHVIGLGFYDALRQVVPDLPRERYGELGQRFRHHFIAAQDELSLFEGTVEMLRSLKARHHWLAIATGKSRRGLDEVLQDEALKGLFDGSRTADETAGKPHPQMLLELMREFGAEPERTLMIGDTSHDLQLAQNAGTASVAVSYGAHEVCEFAAFAPLHTAHSVADLQQWLLANA
ncbi:HAD-IA family hydrolase [Paucibacter sp. APW11]|uniref:HAD-IA family hydrolase n=1 Tax=Roseateles aquae TaxID=3077235 RepID=A0ABU3PGM1_9BURK|nr:HAD-IA family hydrolase [Paucibacter sp. APW11]MDT9001297.1 HAD-IA family hydrolase [Paucibacter sp. APW11]